MSNIPTSGEAVIVVQMPGTAGGELPKEAPSPGAPKDESNPSKNPKDGTQSGGAKLAVAISSAKNLGMQGVNAAVSNIGLATGNYHKQGKAELAIQAGQTMMQMATAMTNPWTALVSAIGFGITATSEEYKLTRETQLANYNSEQYAKRIGYTVDRR